MTTHHVETYMVQRTRKWIGRAIHTETGTIAHSSYGHASERPAEAAAEQWIKNRLAEAAQAAAI